MSRAFQSKLVLTPELKEQCNATALYVLICKTRRFRLYFCSGSRLDAPAGMQAAGGSYQQVISEISTSNAVERAESKEPNGSSIGRVVAKTPDFVKCIPVWKAMEETTIVAYEMNGQPLPHFNGFPARVIVPGWTGTYWMKHVTSINAVTKQFSGFWMNPAYRIPLHAFPLVERFTSHDSAVSTPITEMVMNSLITSHTNGASVRAGAPVTIGGIAWDGGYGIRTVEISTDGGKTWVPAMLGEDIGRFAFRTFSASFSPKSKGKHIVMARATNKIGQSQTAELIPNPAGYHHNIMHSIALTVT